MTLRIDDLTVPGPHGPVPVRVYRADDAGAGGSGARAGAGSGSGSAGVVWAHGGGFQWGDLDMPEADWVARAFASRGIHVISVDYRLASPSVHYPVPSDDVEAALAWTRAHAASLGIDPDRIVLAGASAGGNLAAGVALRVAATAAAPRALFLAYPTLHAVQSAPSESLRALLDANPEADRFGPDAVRTMYEGYLGGPVDGAPVFAVPGLATADDVRSLPPVLIVTGEADELRVSAEDFARTLGAAGVPVQISLEPGTEHGHLNRPEQPAAARTIARVTDWIATF
ncbi:alpha/beta hydrolase [Agromyces atrinae]|uniref:Acetyl esterase/lipase n=1 Tax=Agromyces atrinae TaxID=592376 RepID=A0A852SJW3_9MICO|nr:alpha/beta fold hydrolase [Agromyces atrinae]NYD67539.1 acetyl esterase/lipase [Agromyces atrinae]